MPSHRVESRWLVAAAVAWWGLGASLVGCGKDGAEASGDGAGYGANAVTVTQGVASAGRPLNAGDATSSPRPGAATTAARPGEASPEPAGLAGVASAPGAGTASLENEAVASRDAGVANPGRLDGSAPPEPAFNPCPTTGACAILPLGDSITAGTGSTHGAGYRLELFRLAQSDGQALTFVGRSRSGPTELANVPFPRSHEGHSGYLIDTGPERPGLLPIMDAVFAAVTPNIVLLMIGTNDIPWNLDLPNEPKRLGILIDKITSLAPNALVVVAQISPTGIPDRTVLVSAYNAGIPAVVAERVAAGKHVALVDMFTPFADTPDYATTLLVDEVHPNDAGHVIIGQTWYAAIRTYLRPLE